MSRDDYSQRQKARDAEYQHQYRAWVESLPPDERRKLESQGLDVPDVAHHGNGSATGDAADSPLMRIGDDPAGARARTRTTGAIEGGRDEIEKLMIGWRATAY